MAVLAKAPALIAATLTPRGPGGRFDHAVVEDYFASLLADGVDRLAVSCHTGRPDGISVSELAALCTIAREVGGQPIAGVPWAPRNVSRDEWAKTATDNGATALMLIPPQEEVDAEVLVEAHHRLDEQTRLPIIAFALYSSPSLPDIDRVLREANVSAVKSAFLEDMTASRALLRAARLRGILPISGEDLFLAESIAWGYDAALVGLAAAAPQVCAALIEVGRRGRNGGHATCALDAVARVGSSYSRLCFPGPGDGYIDHMSWIAADEGRIPPHFAPPPRAGTQQIIEAARRAALAAQAALAEVAS